ncbi:protein unc-93 homolog A-like [Penaeus indicus]|uniref:protein unc-93 homolog A-like n=1 Tax=Penaeus indicus TaxID=29960 RepID=UPI00300D3EA8
MLCTSVGRQLISLPRVAQSTRARLVDGLAPLPRCPCPPDTPSLNPPKPVPTAFLRGRLARKPSGLLLLGAPKPKSRSRPSHQTPFSERVNPELNDPRCIWVLRMKGNCDSEKRVTESGKRLAELEGVESEVVITRFFGIFFLFYQTTQVWGNVISSTVLSVGVEKNKTAEDLLTCGYNFCLDQRHEDSPSNTTASTDRREDGPSLWKIYTMASIYLGCSLLAAAVAVFFVDPLSRVVKESPDSQEKNGLALVAATFNQLRHPYQLLIIPLTIWSGVEQAFLGADYTAAFVSCGLGVHMVGYIIICYGVCDAICSAGFSPIVRKYGRVPVFSLGFLINLGLNITLTYWMPKPDDLVVFFVISGLWGVADAVWQTQINTLYGVIFPGESEAAFSNYRLWESTGFIIAYACSTVLCVSSKIVVLNVFLLLGIAGYYVIEILEKRGGLEKDSDGKVVVLDRLFLRALKKGRAAYSVLKAFQYDVHVYKSIMQNLSLRIQENFLRRKEGTLNLPKNPLPTPPYATPTLKSCVVHTLLMMMQNWMLPKVERSTNNFLRGIMYYERPPWPERSMAKVNTAWSKRNMA